MSYFLVGPYPFDPNSVTSSGRAALSAVTKLLRSKRAGSLLEEPSAGDAPGLYIVLEADQDASGAPAIAGFWVTFGNSYLDDGTAGPPDRHPPYASGLLDAATEEVWWKNLPVRTDRRGTWRPIVVLEWPTGLASRSAVPPPGVVQAIADESHAEGGDVEAWLDPTDVPSQRAAAVEAREDAHDPYAGVPTQRSLVAVVRGNLTYDRSLHRGSTRLLPTKIFEDVEGPLVITQDDWIRIATRRMKRSDLETDPEDEEHSTGRPLELPGGRVGFPIQGWLTRNLEIWPPQPKEIRPGTLTDRVVRTKWKGQVAQALFSTATVLTLVMALAIGVRLAAEPHPRTMPVEPPPAPQPVMSVCSADHQQFVDEFRCQIKHMAASAETFPGAPVCGDPGSKEAVDPSDDDLQAAYCGLLDRGRDNWKGNRFESDRVYNFAHLAASQACFNVLGHPYTYEQPTGYARMDAKVPDPAKFLDDDALRIASLKRLVDDLEGACDTYRKRLEHLAEGAVFATHVGAALSDDPLRDSEPAAMRRLLLKVAMEGMPADAKLCFQQGASTGMDGSQFLGLCGPADRADNKHNEVKIWRELGRSPPPADDPMAQVLERYVSARFGVAGGRSSLKSQEDLWNCHLTLKGLMFPLVGDNVPTKWDLSLPVPDEYRIAGVGARSQLVLDAALWAFEDGLQAGTCWNLVKKRLRTYKPVHPLLAELDPEGWPSEEQQLCGQVCATVYRMRSSPESDRWVTAEADLSQCLTTKEPASDRPDMGRGALDRLRLPWNGSPRVGWQTPTAAQICAFNLVAQDYLPSEEGSYIVGAKAPVQWAGETASGSRIAGGEDGLATQAVEGMHRYGTASSWSVGRCGHVAIQCFTSVMTDVMGDPKMERYEWVDEWSRRIEDYANVQSRTLAVEQPWCHPIQPYLSVQREVAEFDAPCRRGVEQARGNAQWALSMFASGLATVAGGD